MQLFVSLRNPFVLLENARSICASIQFLKHFYFVLILQIIHTFANASLALPSERSPMFSQDYAMDLPRGVVVIFFITEHT